MGCPLAVGVPAGEVPFYEVKNFETMDYGVNWASVDKLGAGAKVVAILPRETTVDWPSRPLRRWTRLCSSIMRRVQSCMAAENPQRSASASRHMASTTHQNHLARSSQECPTARSATKSASLQSGGGLRTSTPCPSARQD